MRRDAELGAVTMGVRESSIPMSYTTGESQFVRLCLQDMVDKEGLELEVSISSLAAA